MTLQKSLKNRVMPNHQDSIHRPYFPPFILFLPFLIRIYVQYYNTLNFNPNIPYDQSSIQMGNTCSGGEDATNHNTFKKAMLQQINQFKKEDFQPQKQRLHSFLLTHNLFIQLNAFTQQIDSRLIAEHKPIKPNSDYSKNLIWYWYSLKELHHRLEDLLEPRFRMKLKQYSKLYEVMVKPTGETQKIRIELEESRMRGEMLKNEIGQIDGLSKGEVERLKKEVVELSRRKDGEGQEKVGGDAGEDSQSDIQQLQEQLINTEKQYKDKIQKYQAELQQARDKILNLERQLSSLKRQSASASASTSSYSNAPTPTISSLQLQAQTLKNAIKVSSENFHERQKQLLLELYDLRSAKTRLNELEYELYDTKQQFERYRVDMEYQVRHRESFINKLTEEGRGDEEVMRELDQEKERCGELHCKNEELNKEIEKVKQEAEERLKEKESFQEETSKLRSIIYTLTLQLTFLPSSSIVTSVHRTTLISFFPNQITSSQLLYRASSQKFQRFTQFCQNHSNLFVIIKSQMGICGGYSYTMLQKQSEKDEEGKSFLFWEGTKIIIKRQKQPMKLDEKFGPVFGENELAVMGKQMNLDMSKSDGAFEWGGFQVNGWDKLTEVEIEEYEVYKLEIQQ